MRIRTVKPDWLEDEDLATASSDARVLSIALILSADDEGRLRCSETVLAGRVFPGRLDGVDLMTGALAELERSGFLIRYQVDGKAYAVLPGFGRHQKIDRPTASKLPPPPTDSLSPRRALDESSTSAQRDIIEPSARNSVGREGKGREGKGVEGIARDSGGESSTSEESARTLERETLCPANFEERLPDAVVSELADAHRVPTETIKAELREFVGYWTIGGGAGKARGNWPKVFRQHCHRRAQRGELGSVGANPRASPGAARQRAVDPDYMARC